MQVQLKEWADSPYMNSLKNAVWIIYFLWPDIKHGNLKKKNSELDDYRFKIVAIYVSFAVPI